MSKTVILQKLNTLASKHLKILLIGNPNCGKTTLFNRFTGSRQYVGNWPGVTVEKKEGKFKYKNKDIAILDLPGIYSLSPYSCEEIITRNCILKENYDLIINIIDATNLERNLYLTTQIAELNIPVVIALNMIDIVEKQGNYINFNLLSKKLNIPVIPISAGKDIGINTLLNYCINFDNRLEFNNIYSNELNNILENIENIIINKSPEFHSLKRFYSIKIFESDSLVMNLFKFSDDELRKIQKYKNIIPTTKYLDREMIIADQRYKYICKICSLVVTKHNKYSKSSISDKIDKIITNKILAIPLFLNTMFFVFFLTFGPIGNNLKNFMEWLIKDLFANFIFDLLTNIEASEWIISLIVKGIIYGVGSVVAFFPQIMILFMLLSILEDTGYMARAAFIMDHLLRKIGLSGKAFVPMIMGFGCTVPAILGTKILEKPKDRKLAIMIIPFMSCSAKMPVYALFVPLFFVKYQPIVIFSIYLFGILIAIFTALLFKNTLFRGECSSFVMELPEYRLPTFRNLWLHVWDRLKDFLSKAGTVLILATMIIWFFQSFNFNLEIVQNSSESMLANIGSFISPIFTLSGFPDWRISVSLVTGIVAKESVVSTMAVLYNTGTSDLSLALSKTFSPISAYSFMTFVLLYTPCIAAISAIKKEIKSIKWTSFIVLYQLAIAFLASSMIYQIGSLTLNIINHNIKIVDVLIAIILIVFILSILVLKFKRKNNKKCKSSCLTCSLNCSQKKHK